MTAAKVGDTVVLHYTGRLPDGSVFDSSEQRDPLRLTLGETQLIPGFQNAVVGMEQGEKKTATIACDQAYGDPVPEMVMDFSREQVPDGMSPQIGQGIELKTQSGQTVPARIVKVTDEQITVDANHPLAGQDLTFDIHLVELIPAG